MKVVWVLNHYSQEPGGPGGTRHFSLARNLQAYGWEAYLIASSVEHGTGRQRLEPQETMRFEAIEGVRFLWLKCRTYAANGFDRVGNMLDYTLRALRLKAGTETDLPRPDVVIGSSVHPLAAWAGLRLAKKFGVPFVFEVRDLWPQTLIDMGRLGKNHPASWLMFALERYLYRQAALVVTLLPYSIDYIASRGVDRSKILWLPNGADPGSDPLPALENDQFTFMYFGAHGQANNLDNILDAMVILQERHGERGIRCRFIGDGPQKARLQEKARAAGLLNVTFENPVPKARIPMLASAADCFVFNLADTPVFKYGISSNKLFDYMAAGRPVVFACAAGNNPVKDADAGMTVPPDNPEVLARAMLDMAGMPAERIRQMGANGRRYLLDNHDNKRLAETLGKHLDAVVGR